MDRENNFDALRLVAAIAVIFSHSFLLADGRQDHEPLMILTGGQVNLGVVAVFVFFSISGYLVTQSFETTPSPLHYLAKRALRIYPGLAACLLLLAFVLGPLLTTLPPGDYLGGFGPYRYVLSNLLLNADDNGLPGLRFTFYPFGHVVDGPLWTLPCEILMYLMVFALGVRRLLSLPVIAALTAAGMVCLRFDTAASGLLLGSAGWLLGFFAAGMALYRLRRTRIFDGRVAALALAGLVASIPLQAFILLFPLFGSYLALYLALNRRLPALRAARFGDLSYGLYIYGWPVEQTAMYATGGLRWWWLFAISLPVSAALAFLSWHLVEKRALRLKPRPARAAASYPAPAPTA